MAYIPINVPPHPGAEPGAQATAEAWTRYINLLTLHQNAIIANQRAQYEDACAAANASHVEAIAAFPAAFAPTIDKVMAAWAAHDAALDRLTAALGSLPAVGGGSGSAEGLTASHVQLVAGLAAAIRPTP